MDDISVKKKEIEEKLKQVLNEDFLTFGKLKIPCRVAGKEVDDV